MNRDSKNRPHIYGQVRQKYEDNSMGKDSLFNKLCCNNWMFICHSYQDSMVLAQRQKYRSMEQNRKPRDKSTHIWTPYL